MPSAGTYRRSVEWAPGDFGVRRLDVGSVAQVNPEASVALGFLRIGYVGALLGHPVTAMLSPAVDGGLIGPIDVPFTIIVEEPVQVTLTPTGVPAALVRVYASVVPLCAPYPVGDATRTLVLLAGAVETLPQWVTAVASAAPASYTFLDRSGAPISGVLTGVNVKPSAANSIAVVAGGVIVLIF